MAKLNIGNTAIEVNTAINKVRANIVFLQSKIETLKLTSTGEDAASHFFEKRLEAQKLTLNWLVGFE